MSNYVSAGTKIKMVMQLLHMKAGDLSEKMGISRQAMGVRFRSDNMKENEIRKIAELLGCEVKIVFVLPNGEEI